MFVYFLIFALVAFGLFSIFEVRLSQFSKSLAKSGFPPSTYEIVTGETGNFLTRRIRAQFREMREILTLAGEGNKYDSYCRLSFILAIAGAVISILMGNMFLLPVSTLLGLLIPLLLARFSATNYRRRQSAEELPTLSIVTSSYKRTDSILISVAENIQYLHNPFKSVFKMFLAQNEFVTSNVEKSLMDIKGLIKDDSWRSWCDAMIICQQDRTQKDMLDTILNNLRNKASVQMELDATMYGPIREFVTMVVLVLINFPLLYFINRSWFNSLFFTVPGKIAVAFTAATVLYSLFAVIRATRPIEYKR